MTTHNSSPMASTPSGPDSNTAAFESDDAATNPTNNVVLGNLDVTCFFEPELDNKYQCPICLGVLLKPVQTSCGHRFCRMCFKRAVRNQPLQNLSRRAPVRICPVDKMAVECVFEDVAVAREILSLVVQCRNRERGCVWSGEYRQVTDHQGECDYESVPCRMRCDTIVLRKDMLDHMNYCPKRLEPCKLCGKVILPWDLKHLFFECSHIPIPCIYCDRRYRRETLTQHTDPIHGDCPCQEVSCRYQNLGCTAKCQRKDLSGHNELCRQEHMLLMLKRIESLENKIHLLETPTARMSVSDQVSTTSQAEPTTSNLAEI